MIYQCLHTLGTLHILNNSYHCNNLITRAPQKANNWKYIYTYLSPKSVKMICFVPRSSPEHTAQFEGGRHRKTQKKTPQVSEAYGTSRFRASRIRALGLGAWHGGVFGCLSFSFRAALDLGTGGWGSCQGFRVWDCSS